MRPYFLEDLELRHLLALQAIAETGSFWAAAERLGYSQSALSQQISTVLCVNMDERHGQIDDHRRTYLRCRCSRSLAGDRPRPARRQLPADRKIRDTFSGVAG